MNLATLRSRFRSRIDDTVSPYLLSDTQVDDLINEAYEQACIRGRLLRARQTLDLTSGTAEYPLYRLGPPVLYVDRVEYPADEFLTRTSMADLEQRYSNRAYGSGTPCVYALDGQAVDDSRPGTIWFGPTPNQALTVTVHYTAVPDRLSFDTDEPQLPVYMRSWLLYGALSIAYEHHDIDVLNREDQARYEALFERRFGPLPSALELTGEQTRGWPVVIPE